MCVRCDAGVCWSTVSKYYRPSALCWKCAGTGLPVESTGSRGAGAPQVAGRVDPGSDDGALRNVTSEVKQGERAAENICAFSLAAYATMRLFHVKFQGLQTISL